MSIQLYTLFKGIQRRISWKIRSIGASRRQPAVDAVTLEIQRLEKIVADMLSQMPDKRRLAPVPEPVTEYQKICDMAG